MKGREYRLTQGRRAETHSESGRIIENPRKERLSKVWNSCSSCNGDE
jgi:hypothetical protein